MGGSTLQAHVAVEMCQYTSNMCMLYIYVLLGVDYIVTQASTSALHLLL